MNNTHHELNFKHKYNMQLLKCEQTCGYRMTQTHLSKYHDLKITNYH